MLYTCIYTYLSLSLHKYIYIYRSIYSSTFCDRPFSRWWQEGWWWKLTLLWAIIGRPWQSLPRIWRTPFVGMGPDGCGIKTREGVGYFELKRCALNLQNSQNHLVSMGNCEGISSQDCKHYIIIRESLQNPGVLHRDSALLASKDFRQRQDHFSFSEVKWSGFL